MDVEEELFLNPKQVPTQPKNPLLGAALLGFAPMYGWLAAIWAEAKPTITKVKAATSTSAMMIFVLFILIYQHIIIYGWRLMVVGLNKHETV